MLPNLAAWANKEELKQKRGLAFSKQLTTALRHDLRKLVSTMNTQAWIREDLSVPMVASDKVQYMRKFWIKEQGVGRICLCSAQVLPSAQLPDFNPPNDICCVFLNNEEWPIVGPFASELFDTLCKRRAASMKSAERGAQALMADLLLDPAKLASVTWAPLTSERGKTFTGIFGETLVLVSELYYGTYFGKKVHLYEVTAGCDWAGEEITFTLQHGNAAKLFKRIERLQVKRK